MRVYAPGRLVPFLSNQWTRTEGNKDFVFGIPLDGEWIDVPSYFKQVTSGRPINDVVHAQLVDDVGDKYTVADLQCRYPGTSGIFGIKQNQVVLLRTPSVGSAACLSTYASYHVENRVVELGPSPNYKGRKRTTRRVERYVRVLNPFGLRLTVTVSATARPGSPWGPYDQPRVSIWGYLYVPRYPEVDKCFNADGSFEYIEVPIGFNTHLYAVGAPDVYPSDGGDIPVVSKVASELTRFLPSINLSNRDGCLPELWGIIASTFSRDAEATGIYLSLRANSGAIASKHKKPVACTPVGLPDYDPKLAFLLNEDQIIGERLDPVLLGKDVHFTKYWREYLVQHALLAACESLPRLSDNSISNLIELVGFVKSVVVDHKVEMPKSLADAWLAYRYQYSTSKMDIQDAIKFVRRRMDLGTLDRQIAGYGVATHVVEGTEVVCRVSVEVRPREVDQLHKIIRALDTYGLTPDFYVIWDSIPYSFMVDWFLPISDLAGVADANSMYFSGQFYDFVGISCSLSYTRELGPRKVKCYTRWAGSVPSGLNGMYWLEPPTASARTVGFRALDAVSIFFGR